ncbi:MAG: Cytochrome c [Planctomycetaceae bacterium]|nr:Cytochrome c [Planctomycetaceae bacterium]
MHRAALLSLLLSSLTALLPIHILQAEDFPTPKNTEKATTSPMAPDEVVRTAKLPPGFVLSVFAAEPHVQNPIAITTDERGRLWVAENYSWAGGGAGGFDPNQRDRIVVLEDSDGDGKHDKRTVFWDSARKLTSVEVGYGGVWAICLPNLLFIPDANRDDVPDSAPQVVLDGLNEGTVGHTPANGLKWGPDGWLYARHGIQATSSIGKPGSGESQRIKINTGVWRYHPTRGAVETVMHGMTNSWGYDFDQHGEQFVINTVIGHLWHVVPGAHTRRMYGIDLNPHTYQLIEQTADHVHWDTGESWSDVRKGITDKTSAAGGGHAHIGLMIYQGDNWPEEYRNRAYTLNLHGLRINSDILVRQGAGYTAKHGPDLCFLKDPWFRGMDLITGPDGGVFIADWSDTGECHDHDGVHRTSGRIYKLTHGQPKKVPAFDLATAKSSELVQLQLKANTWWPRQARRILEERAAKDAQQPDLVEARDAIARLLLQDDLNIRQRLRLLESIHALRGTVDVAFTAPAKISDEHERALRLRLIIEVCADDRAGLAPDQALDPARRQAVLEALLLTTAQSDPSGLVQLYVASAMQRLTVDKRWSIAEALAAKPDFANDRMFPLMVWYGIEPSVPRDPVRALALAKSSRIPFLTECIARRLTLEIERDPATVDKLVALAVKDESAHGVSIISGMALALNGWQKAKEPAGWPQAADKFSKLDNADVKRHLQGLSVVFGDGRALDELRKLVTDGNAEPESRRQALRALLVSKPADYVPTLFNLLGDRAMIFEAIRGLAQYDHPDTPQQLFNRSGIFGLAERSEMINTLVSRPAYAKVLMEALRNKKIAATEITAFHARQIRSFENEGLTKDLTELWGDVRVTAAEKRTLIDQFKTQLTSSKLAQANLSSGRATFQKTCANCHVLYGVGRKLGPDITGSNRKNLDYLLENVVDPSASVGADFRALTVILDSGRVLSGVVSEQNERTLTLQTAQEPVTLDRKQIEETKQTNLSVMPDGLLQNLNPEQIRDLMGYLMSTEQVALPN